MSPNFESFFDLTAKSDRLQSLEASQAEAGFWANPESARRTVQELQALRGWVGPWADLHGRLTGALELAELLETERDEALETDLARETDALVQAVEAFELKAMLQGPDDRRDALLTIHPGAGGTESQDWAEMLMRMYVRWAERHGFQVAVLDLLPGEEAGLKSVSIQIKGEYAYGYLKAEKGVHRLVRISPYDSQARRHTSFASVFVYPDVDDTIEIDLRDEDIRMDVFRASGAGGQHVNKTSSRIEIAWNIAQSRAISDEQRTRLLSRLSSRLSEDGAIRVVASETRSQLRNREAAEQRTQREQEGKAGPVHPCNLLACNFSINSSRSSARR